MFLARSCAGRYIRGTTPSGMKSGFFDEVTNFVVDQMKDAYPELESHREYIKKMVRLEEERFGATLITGLMKLEDLLDEHEMEVDLDGRSDVQAGCIPADKLAKLYDTFGTPIDLMYVVIQADRRGRSEYCRSQGWFVSSPGNRSEISKMTGDEFNEIVDVELRRLQQQSKTDKSGSQFQTKPVYVALSRRHNTKSEFNGYDVTQIDDAKVISLIKGDNEVHSLNEGDEGEVILDRTPFYAESGGQVGDRGFLSSGILHTGKLSEDPDLQWIGKLARKGSSQASVDDTFSPISGLIVHLVNVSLGMLRVGDQVTAQVDVEKRDATRRNHTATHLMHAALREVLGIHVKQAGSVVAPNYLRFDFSHYQPLTGTEIAEIERLVNYHILRNEPVATDEMAIEEAMRSGAMALFGGKVWRKGARSVDQRRRGHFLKRTLWRYARSRYW